MHFSTDLVQLLLDLHLSAEQRQLFVAVFIPRSLGRVSSVNALLRNLLSDLPIAKALLK